MQHKSAIQSFRLDEMGLKLVYTPFDFTRDEAAINFLRFSIQLQK